MMIKNILTIGAYERDNFGDCLFFWIAKEALNGKKCNIIPGSIIDSDMREYIGEYVFPYHFLLNNYKWDAVWIVGGEIGGVDIEGALSMSLKKKEFDIYKKIDEVLRSKVRKSVIGDIDNQLAYLPNWNIYEKNHETSLIINSVGGFELLELNKGSDLFNKALSSLKKSDILSVRNETTFNYLKSLNIKTELNPDVVHALPFFYPINKNIEEEYFLFQINEDLLNRHSVEKIANILKKIIFFYGHKIYLFIAGSARFHDNEDQYLKIKRYLNEELNEDKIGIVKEKNPLNLVNWIANSKLWIGTSLHGRIVSTAYCVKRVGLENEKVTSYCRVWDDVFPYNIKIDDLMDACDKALKVVDDYTKSKAEDLANKAKSSLDNIIEKIYGN